MNTIDYATRYRMAYDLDTMVNVVNAYQRQKKQPVPKKRRNKRNKWENVFPIWKGVK